jgi:DNA polymerase I
LQLTFWLLDINTETKAGAPELWLWGIDTAGNRVLVVDQNFLDYFYAVLQEGCDPSEAAKRIEQTCGDRIQKLEPAQRRYFGKPVQTIKIFCDNPSKVAKAVQKLEGVKECLEDDIRISMRYLIDNGVVPCSWHQAAVTESEKTFGAHVDKAYLAQSAPKLIEKTEPPQLRVLSFYMTCYSREGSPKPDRNPVIILSVATSTGQEKQFLADENRNDKRLLQDFIAYIKAFDPDVIAGYGTNTLDLTYLRQRCELLGLTFAIDRTKTEPHTSVYGHMSLTGVANLDLADFADQFPKVKVKTLENLADHLGVMKLDQRTLIWDVDFADFWDNPQKRGALEQFALDNARCVRGMAEVLLESALQFSSLVSLPLDHVMTAATGFRVDWFLIKRAYQIGELVPKREEQPYRTYTGGLVLKPQPGLHENIAVLDFVSMYPNLMIYYNLSPDTYLPPEDQSTTDYYEAPEVRHRFRKQPPGFYKEILTYLIGARKEIRAQMKTLNPRSVEYSVLDARQKAVKITANATYGYAGWVGARWYSKPVAEAATAWGRHTIQTAQAMAEQAGLKVIYGDTDSLFASYDSEKTPQLTRKIKAELGLSIELDNVYVRILFTEAKKRYAGLLTDGTLDIVGLEVIRGDWAEVAKKVQEKVLEIVLKDQSPQKATAYVHTVIADLRAHKVPYHDLIVWKTLSKPIEEYAVNAGHVEAAKLMQRKGWKMTVGDKVGYVITKGKGRLYGRVKPYMYASPDEVDVEYYTQKQVVPAAVRVLEFFGVTEKDLLSGEKKETKEKSLVDFLGV